MSVDGEICAFVRGAKDKRKAVEIASVVFSRPAMEIHRVLKNHGLMAEDGSFLEPLRLTGKEITKMAETVKGFRWVAASKTKLEKMFVEGKTLEEMAEAFNLTVEDINKQLKKMGLEKAVAGTALSPGSIVLMQGDDSIVAKAWAIADEVRVQVEESVRVFSEMEDQGMGFYALGRVRQSLDELTRLLDPKAEIDPSWQQWTPRQYIAGLEHPIAEKGFGSDMTALRECDICVLVLPCNRSAHLEAGWAAGNGKRLYIYIPEPMEPELMYKMADGVYGDMEDLICAICNCEQDDSIIERELTSKCQQCRHKAAPPPGRPDPCDSCVKRVNSGIGWALTNFSRMEGSDVD